jgi:hypothetical protein
MITERELDKAEGFDAVIEQIRFSKIKVLIVPISKGAIEVEVHANKLGNGITRVVGGDGGEKGGLVRMGTRGINIRETKTREIRVNGEIERKDVIRRGGVSQGEEEGVLGGENATGRTICIYH